MTWEELDQEQEVNDDLDLDSDSDVDDGESIIARIQYFLGENDDILRAKDRKQRNRIFRAIHDGKFEVVLDDFIDSSPSASCSCRTEPRPLPTHLRSRRSVATRRARQPDRRRRPSALRWSSDTSGASWRIFGALRRSRSCLWRVARARARPQFEEHELGKRRGAVY
ncbi:hypothetical protein EDB83DRAFT_2370253 [Lactarius deliciosus]|nr:hypothetical protein EDB83DRAFT_2370253 [Lactarius deliciosus]